MSRPETVAPEPLLLLAAMAAGIGDLTLTQEWAKPQPFDRQRGYDPGWLRYEKVDIYGQPLRENA